MGFNVGSLNSNMYAKMGIEPAALQKVSERILSQDANKTIDVAKLNLNGFNRPTLGLDLYAANTNAVKAAEVAKAMTDFNVNFSKAFEANVQYLNSQAAQSLFTSKENNGKVVIAVDNTNTVNTQEAVIATTQVAETTEMKKDRKGSNPFSFYMELPESEEKETKFEPLFA